MRRPSRVPRAPSSRSPIGDTVPAPLNQFHTPTPSPVGLLCGSDVLIAIAGCCCGCCCFISEATVAASIPGLGSAIVIVAYPYPSTESSVFTCDVPPAYHVPAVAPTGGVVRRGARSSTCHIPVLTHHTAPQTISDRGNRRDRRLLVPFHEHREFGLYTDDTRSSRTGPPATHPRRQSRMKLERTTTYPKATAARHQRL